MYPTTVLSVWSLLLALATFLPMVKDSYWIYRILEYPRLQKLLLLVLTLVAWIFVGPFGDIFQTISFVLLLLSAAYVTYKVWPYTIFFPKEIRQVPAGSSKNGICILTANVYQDNRQYDRLLRQVKAADADLVFLVETDSGWAEAVAGLAKDYPYSLHEPLDNTYGLILYSRLPMKEARVSYLVKEGIPSVEAVITLPSGQDVRIWGLHPEPPVPGESLSSAAKDKELMKVALKVRDCRQPCIVFGDLNDVAWSYTTELFRKTSRLLDPRRGRGFYSTFSARNFLIRFPLDYIFCSDEFQLVEMRRMPPNGSDHFATMTHFSFQPGQSHHNQEPEADRQELTQAREIASGPAE